MSKNVNSHVCYDDPSFMENRIRVRSSAQGALFQYHCFGKENKHFFQIQGYEWHLSCFLVVIFSFIHVSLSDKVFELMQVANRIDLRA